MPTLKNIIILNDYDYVNGGISQIAITSANEMAEKGYHIIFISAVTDPARSTLSDKVERHSTNQFDILGNPSRIDALQKGLWNTHAARLLGSVLQDKEPGETIIHLHSWIKALSPSIGKVLSNAGFPVLCTLHDFFTACPNGGFFIYPRNEICHLRPMSLSCICTNCDSRNYAQKLWRVARQAVQSGFGKIPGGIKDFISVTKFSENILRPYLPSGAEIHPLSNPVTYSEPARPRADVSSGRILFIGRLSPEKGIQLACDAARAAGVRLSILGEGPLKIPLQQQYPEVDFLGWLSPAAVFREMLQSTALVFPSIWYETQGLVVLEALSAGLPVIVADRCAASDYVDGHNGLIFKAGNSPDLAEKIRLITEDPGKAEKMSQYAYRKYWENPFLLEKFIDDSLDIYKRILQKKNITANPS